MKRFPLDESLVVQMYEDGAKLDDIATHFGTTRNTIRTRLLSLGKPLRDMSAKSRVNHNGYEHIFMPDHSMANRSGHVLVHRLRVAESIGRPLEHNETVHHKDGNKLNNDLSNLQLRVGRHGKHGCYECVDCGSRNIRAIPI